MKKLIILAAVLALTAVGFARQVSADVHILGTIGGGGVGVGLSLAVETIRPIKISKEERAYSVKFLCGTVSGVGQFPIDPASPLVPGTYLTAINIHNPSREDVVMQLSSVLTHPSGQVSIDL